MPNSKTKTAAKKAPADKHPKPPFRGQHQDKPGQESQLEPRPRYQAPEYKASGKLKGRRALITGGDSGIGRAVAVLFAREGAEVAITCLPNEGNDAEETREAVEAEGQRCVVIAGDLSEPEFCVRCIEGTVSELGGLDILVSNAAHQNHKERIEDVTDEELDRTFKTNVYAYFWLVRAALPHLKPGAAIIATSSITGIKGNPDLPDYSASKGAINALTKALAQNLVDRGIRVNAVAPGPVWTPLNVADRGTSPEDVAKFGSDTPYQRPAQPEEIAPAYVFFASDADSSFITGEVLTELGGQTTAAA